MNIAFAYNIKKNEDYSTETDQTDIEFDSQDVIDEIVKIIKSLGHNIIKIEADENAFENLKKNKSKIDLVFNIAEGLSGDARESQIPLFCEILKIPYTHSSPTTHAIKLHKHMTKLILQSTGVNIPKSVVATSANFDTKKLKFPFIVKPNKQGSSKGIFNDSVVHNEDQLKKAVSRVLKEFDVEALIEEYIEGREFTVALLGNPPKVLPIVEQRFDFLPKGFNKVAGYELKWIYEEKLKTLTDGYFCPAKLGKKVQSDIEKTSKVIWDTLDVKDCARIDYRLNKKNKLYFIEINTLPGINPFENTISYLPLAARVGGISSKKLIETIISNACKRYKIKN